MRNGNRRIKMLSALLAAVVLAACAVPARAEEATPYDGGLRIKEGTLLPMCEYSDPRDPAYSNENSDILRFCVYVETDCDTDNDGMADLVKALVQVPRAAVEGKYRAATIYDPTPTESGPMRKHMKIRNICSTKSPLITTVCTARARREFRREK